MYGSVFTLLTIKDIHISLLFVNNTFLMCEGSVLPLKVISSLHKFILLLNDSTFSHIQCDAQGDFFPYSHDCYCKVTFSHPKRSETLGSKNCVWNMDHFILR